MFACPLSNISTLIERTAGSIGIKFGVSGRWFLINRILNNCNLFCLNIKFTFLISYYNCLSGIFTLQIMLYKKLNEISKTVNHFNPTATE